jgi:tRNA threonylcarbamoyladenosine dehydratase
MHEFSRTELLIGKAGLKKLRKAKVAVFGVGGVGSYTVEGLARTGVGRFVLVDDDRVCLTNINRQLHATRKTVGRAKVEVMKERILDINPDADVETFPTFYLPDCGHKLVRDDYDYIADAIDTVTAKIDLVVRAKALGVPVISCMGAGNKLDPTRFQVTDLYSTSVCPLCKVMRRELRLRGIDALKVVYSPEAVIKPEEENETGCRSHCVCPKGTTRTCTQRPTGTLPQGFPAVTSGRRQIPGSVAFVPSVAGMILAGEIVKDLINEASS